MGVNHRRNVFSLRKEGYAMNNSSVHNAIMFATKAHQGQVRKGTDIPYIVHPCEVAQILTEMGMEEEVIIAGVLHDTVEDTKVTLEEIEKTFGAEVAELVGGHTEDKSKTWQERKEANVEHLKKGSLNLKAVIFADKLSNIRSLYDDYIKLGDAVWTRFNAPKEKQSWYYMENLKVFEESFDTRQALGLLKEMRRLYCIIFEIPVDELENLDDKKLNPHLCPVCGGTYFLKKNSHDICEICKWEDDGVQEKDPDFAGGANEYALKDYRERFQKGLSVK